MITYNLIHCEPLELRNAGNMTGSELPSEGPALCQVARLSEMTVPCGKSSATAGLRVRGLEGILRALLSV